MSARIYIEGGGDSKEGHSRCREGFRKLLVNSGFSESRRMPRLFACGGRGSAFDDFKTALSKRKPGDFVALLVDSEDPMRDAEKAWEHLAGRDDWEKPADADDDQVLLMTTCMETWIVADRATLRTHYGRNFRENDLPPLANLEGRGRQDVQACLERATRNCTNAYAKGKRSFVVLAALDPTALNSLPSFARMIRILNERL